VQTDRRFIGYDTDAGYVRTAEKRIAEARSTAAPRGRARKDEDSLAYLQAARAGDSAMEIAGALLRDAGFVDVTERPTLPKELELSFAASDRRGGRWYFELSGVMAAGKSGLRNSENVWKTLGKAAVLKSELGDAGRLLLLTTDLPSPASSAGTALAAVKGELYVDVLDLRSARAYEQLDRHAAGDGF
jgi:modification methylase